MASNMSHAHAVQILKDIRVDSPHLRNVLAKVMSLQASGYDVRESLPKIVKLLANQDLVVKKSLYNILTTYSFTDPDVILLATNTLVQECSDSNPMVRGLAIRTLCSLNHDTFLEYGIRAVLKGIKDTSAYVRRTAVLGCGQLNLRSHGLSQEHGLVDQLYRCIRDPDPVVMVNAVVVLQEVLKTEGGIVINKNIAHFLVGKIETMTVWGISYCFQVLKKYKPKTEDEMFDLLNILDPFLVHNNHSVAVSCFELFLHFVEDYPSLKSEVTKRCCDHFLNVIKSESPEITLCVLEMFEKHMTEVSSNLGNNFKVFICKQKDPTYLKAKKVNFLRHVLTEENVMEVLDQLMLLGKDADSDLSHSALKILTYIQQTYPSSSSKCELIFKSLLQSNKDHIVSNCLHVLQNLDFTKLENPADFICMLCQCSEFIKDDTGKCALFTILSNYGNLYEDAPYVLENFIDDLESHTSEVKVHLLHCTVKMFFYYPSICQQMLGRVLEMCSSGGDDLVDNMVSYYYDLLQTDIEAAKHVILNNELKK